MIAGQGSRRTDELIGGRNKGDIFHGCRREKWKLPSIVEDHNPRDHKRHSLHLQARRARERDFPMYSNRDEIRRSMVAVRAKYMHRSHSFSSSSILSDASQDSSGRWVVYGFV